MKRMIKPLLALSSLTMVFSCAPSAPQYMTEDDVSKLTAKYIESSYTFDYAVDVTSVSSSVSSSSHITMQMAREGRKVKMAVYILGIALTSYYEMHEDGNGYDYYYVMMGQVTSTQTYEGTSGFPDIISSSTVGLRTILPFDLMTTTFTKSGSVYSSSETFYNVNGSFTLEKPEEVTSTFHDYVLNVDNEGTLVSFSATEDVNDEGVTGTSVVEASFSNVGTTTVTIPSV